MRASQPGFTLVELAIVLVIIGLLVSGVLVGQTLIRSSELRTVVGEEQKFKVAIDSFKDKYTTLPGDLPNAFAYWGATCGTNTTAASTGCNGDGNGLVENNIGKSEGVKAWEHLSRAGLIEGTYDGTGAMGAGIVVVSTTNVPASKFPNAYWNIGQAVCDNCGFGTPDATGGRLQVGLGTIHSMADPGMMIAVANLTNEEAASIDAKADDGRSFTGTLRSDNGDGYCGDSGTDYYLLTTRRTQVGNCNPTFIIK